MIVVDASVVAKNYLEETHSEKADAIYKGADILIAPALIRVEVAAAIFRSLRKSEITREQAMWRYGLWQSHLADEMIDLIPDEELMDEAVKIAAALSHPLQDCLYLAVAIMHNAPLVTADRKLFDRAKAEQMDVRMLADYGVH